MSGPANDHVEWYSIVYHYYKLGSRINH
jgi:hypothetical protein